ncbi:MAG: hypothetical protein Q8O84_03655 [Nanoarchaeota archaeon]|nr:hypothetical protein [Nanoarchaeota archaeon]
MTETIEMKVINSYEDLEKAEIGEFLKIQNREELKIDPAQLEFVSKRPFKNRVYTIFKEDKYISQHQYQTNFGLVPIAKYVSLIRARTFLGEKLLRIKNVYNQLK